MKLSSGFLLWHESALECIQHPVPGHRRGDAGLPKGVNGIGLIVETGNGNCPASPLDR